MKRTSTDVDGVFVVDIEPIGDERGFFARSWCAAEFADWEFDPSISQCNVSFNHQRGTLRGMHYQHAPHGETKLVRCTRGAIWDVAVDLRPGSPSFRRWTGHELTEDNHRMLYVPDGCAHGFITLTDDTEVFYQMSAPYVGDAAAGVRWNDPAFGIGWPAEPVSLSDRDASYPDFATS